MDNLIELRKPVERLVRGKPLIILQLCGGVHTAIKQFVERGEPFIQSLLCLLECRHVLALCELHVLERFVCRGDELHLGFHFCLEFLVCEHISP